MERGFIWVFDHHILVFVVAIVAGVAILASIGRPRRWFQWAIDAVVVLAIAVASLAFWFFTNVTNVIEHRTNALTYASLNGPDVHRVEEIRGDVVALNFWATRWPPSCKEVDDLC